MKKRTFPWLPLRGRESAFLTKPRWGFDHFRAWKFPIVGKFLDRARVLPREKLSSGARLKEFCSLSCKLLPSRCRGRASDNAPPPSWREARNAASNKKSPARGQNRLLFSPISCKMKSAFRERVSRPCRDGGAAERARFEIVLGSDVYQGSNPCLCAKHFEKAMFHKWSFFMLEKPESGCKLNFAASFRLCRSKTCV